MNNKNLIICFPENYDNTQKGTFFEDFITRILEPMRFKVTSRLRFTGMEIDLLAEGLDQPKKILMGQLLNHLRGVILFKDPVQGLLPGKGID